MSSSVNGPWAVGWQSHATSQLVYCSTFGEALANFNRIVYEEINMVSAGLYEAPTLNGPLVTVATWSPGEGVVRSPSHPKARDVVKQ